MRQSQKSRILKYLQSGKKITPAIAYEKFGCLRLSERIREIEKDFWNGPKSGWKDFQKNVKRGWHKTRHSRVMSYWL